MTKEKAKKKKVTTAKTTKPKVKKTAKSPTAELKKELEESKEKYLRLYAEYENFRRRTAKERLELEALATGRIMTDFLSILDDFERGKQNIDNADKETLIEGSNLIYQKFFETMKTHGIKLMEVNVGDDFDPEYHDAVTKIPAPTKKLKGKIVDVIQKGYYSGSSIIRHAKVVTGE